MGSFANMLFQLMLGWIRRVAADIWSLFSSDSGTSLLRRTGAHWLTIAVILCVTGLIIDLTVYIFRWRPYKVWASFFRRQKERRNEKTQETSAATEESTRTEKPSFLMNEQQTDTSEHVPPRYELNGPDYNRTSNVTIDERPDVSSAESGYAIDNLYDNRGKMRESNTEKFENAIRPRKRRSRVADLFADEQAFRYEAPQTLIDTNEAYYRPVYPKGWRVNEEQLAERNDPEQEVYRSDRQLRKR